MKRLTFTVLLSISFHLHAQAPFDRDFNLLREQRDKAAAVAMDPINRRYQAGLEQLFRRATQGSDLDTALKAKAELQALAAANAPKAPAATATPTATGGVTVVAPAKVRSSNLVLSPESMTWDQAVQWCVANRVQMLSYATWADEKNRDKINDEIGNKGIWVGLSYDFDLKHWVDLDGSVIAKPLFNPEMKVPNQRSKAVGVHALYVGGKSVIYDVHGDSKQRVLATKLP